MTPTLVWVNFLEWLTKLRKICLLARLPIYYKRTLKDMNQQPDEETQGEVLNKGASVLAELGTPHGSILALQVKALQKGPKSCPLGVLWRLHYIVMIDELIGQ